MSGSIPFGTLWLIATPIGNLGDFSPRGKEILSSVDLIACEDTRVTKKLLDFLSITKPLTSYREENEKSQSTKLAEAIESGKSVALLSDAGYPGISDPGFRLVRECRRRGLIVRPVPGANAAITALACSGLPTHQFLYLGFLSKKSVANEKIFQKWKDFEGSIIIYESKYRVEKTLISIRDILGAERWICICRELTKMHETFHIGEVGKILDKIRAASGKGEFTLIVAPKGFNL